MIPKLINSLLIAIVLFVQGVGGKSGVGGKGGFGGRISTLNSCLVSGWPMNEGTGLTLNDVSGNSNTATINSGSALTWTTGALTSGVSSPVWNGTGQAVATSTTLTSFSNTSPFSVLFWINAGGIASPTYIPVNALGAGPNFTGWYIALDQSGGSWQFQFTLENNGSNGITVTATSNPFMDGNTNLMAVTYDGSSNASGVTLYVKGVAVTSPVVRQNNLSASSASATPVTIAALTAAAGGGSNFVGTLGYVAIYNCALTSAQITAANNGGVPKIL